MQPFQCDLQAQIPKHPITTHTQAHPKQLEATVTMRPTKKKWQTDRSRTRRTDEVPFIAGCSHLTRKKTRFHAPASSPKQSPCNIMQPFQCDLQAQIPKHPITTHTQAHPKQLEATVTMRPTKKKRQTDRSRTRRTDEVPFIAGCSHFTQKNTRFRAPASSPTHHLPSSPLPFLTTSHRHHLASSPLPFLTTSHRHHIPLSTSLPHHFPSSPLPFLTTSHRPHLPSSPLAFIITSLRHHFPSSPLPFLTTSHRHHFPSSPLPLVTTSHRHHFPSSPLPIVTTSLRHHFPSSPLPFVTTSLRHHFPSSPPRHCQHPSSRSIPPLLILLLCIVMSCIVTRSTALHHFKSQNSICP